MNIYDYNFINNENEIIEMSSFKEKTILIVNVASNCGFTKNYEELQSLYQDFNKNGLEIIGFPCNQFGEQEPGTDEEIKNFCQINYGVTFPISKKIEVNYPDLSVQEENLVDVPVVVKTNENKTIYSSCTDC